VPDLAFPRLGTADVHRLATELRIDDWEFNRTHWAVKDVDLYRVLHESVRAPLPSPTVFRLPTSVSPDPDLVAVMMPFSPGFSDVYEALKEVAAEAGMTCHRADDIWINEHIMDDVINLLWRARLVIADLSGKNPNVFYETGIAHTLGREVIQIAQSMDDVPFDLRSIRTVRYLSNGEGLARLRNDLAPRLNQIAQRSKDRLA
jgi:hypothetical protein